MNWNQEEILKRGEELADRFDASTPRRLRMCLLRSTFWREPFGTGTSVNANWLPPSPERSKTEPRGLASAKSSGFPAERQRCTTATFIGRTNVQEIAGSEAPNSERRSLATGQHGAGGSARRASVGEEFRDVQGDAGLGWVQGHVLERLDQVVDLGFGVGVFGD